MIDGLGLELPTTLLQGGGGCFFPEENEMDSSLHERRISNRNLCIRRWGCSCCSGSGNSHGSQRSKSELKSLTHKWERMHAKRALQEEIDEYLLDEDVA